MTTDAPEIPAPKRKRAAKAAEPPSAPAGPEAPSPTAGWSPERWGTAVAARVYGEMHRTHADALRHVAPEVRRSLGRVIRQEVERAVAESVAAATPDPVRLPAGGGYASGHVPAHPGAE